MAHRTLKGFRDFLPAEKAARDLVRDRVSRTFERFGFQPLETPTLEYAELIMGKYGEDADRLVYTFEDRGGRRVALPYDQTVPTARVLSQYRSTLPRYFRRYAIRNVFRAESPQRGRYREFTQCDIDIYGSTSTVAEAEIVACAWQAVRDVGFDRVEVRLNDRGLLVGRLTPFATDAVDVFSIVRSIDKLDKLPERGVVDELVGKGLTPAAAADALAAIRDATPTDSLAALLEQARALGVADGDLVFTPVLARGLDYYTGAIFEIVVPEFGAGSVAGGGRYDDLIEQLGGPPTPAVGLAFGFDRLVEAAVERGLVPGRAAAATVLVTLDDDSVETSLRAAAVLRRAGVAVEVYPAPDKPGRQFRHAEEQAIPLVVVPGRADDAGEVSLRRTDRTAQASVTLAALPDAVREMLESAG